MQRVGGGYALGMREHMPKIVIVGLMVLVVGLPFLLRPSTGGGEAAALQPTEAGMKLTIVTPHNEQIRYEFARAYNLDRVARGLSPVEFDWRASGGTSELRRSVLAQYGAAGPDEGIDVDLFFGGGEYDHNKLADAGVTVAPTLPSGLIEAAFPQERIGGERLLHPDRLWIGTALSSFGIVFNRDMHQARGMDTPSEWADLAAEAYEGEIALADPNHSGSITAAYDAILRRTGWTEGWFILRRCFANTRFFTTSSSRIPTDVAAGEAMTGMAIDFYGRFQAGASPEDARDGGLRVAYVDPVRVLATGDLVTLTATTADPISLMRGAPHREIAEDFIAWLLSDEAQLLWQRQIGVEGGPEKYELRRQPILQRLYTGSREGWTDPEIDPFVTAKPITPGVPSFFGQVRLLTRAMAIDAHDELHAAWDTLLRTPADHPNRAEMEELFYRLPDELTFTPPMGEDGQPIDVMAVLEDPAFLEAFAALGVNVHDKELTDDEVAAQLTALNNPDAEAALMSLRAFKLQLRAAGDDDEQVLAWTLFFRDNYRKVVSLGR